MLAPKIGIVTRFLSPGNSLHRGSVRTWFRPTPPINDLPTALTRSFFNVPFALPRTQWHRFVLFLLINGACSVYTSKTRARERRNSTSYLMEAFRNSLVAK